MEDYDFKLCWVGGELEIWNGPKRVCKLTEIDDMDALNHMFGDQYIAPEDPKEIDRLKQRIQELEDSIAYAVSELRSVE